MKMFLCLPVSCVRVYLFIYLLQHFLQITVMDLVVQIQHLHHFTNGGHAKNGWRLDLKVFIFRPDTQSQNWRALPCIDQAIGQG